MIDLRKAKAGDTAKFRCGGEGVIEKISPSAHEGSVKIIFVGESHIRMYVNTGNARFTTTGLMDITEVIKAPEVFDFTKAKWGMAFLSKRTGETLYFIGKRIGGGVWFSGGSSSASIQAFLENYIVENFERTPEHDAESGLES